MEISTQMPMQTFPESLISSRLVAWQNLALKKVSVNTVDNCRAGRKHSTFLHVEDNKEKLQSNVESTLTSTQLQITTNNVNIGSEKLFRY